MLNLKAAADNVLSHVFCKWQYGSSELKNFFQLINHNLFWNEILQLLCNTQWFLKGCTAYWAFKDSSSTIILPQKKNQIGTTYCHDNHALDECMQVSDTTVRKLHEQSKRGKYQIGFFIKAQERYLFHLRWTYDQSNNVQKVGLKHSDLL